MVFRQIVSLVLLKEKANMELIEILRVLRRWGWLIAVLVLVTQLAVWFGVNSAEPVYTASLNLQVSVPQRENVATYDEYRAVNLRDEITIALNNFIEILQSEEVQERTLAQMGLNDEDYKIKAARLRDTDFILVTVESASPERAAEIANTQVAIAIAYYGELRSKYTTAEKELIAGQLQLAQAGLQNAEDALAQFRAHNGIYSIESQIAAQQRLLEQLQSDRDEQLVTQAATGDSGAANSIVEIDRLISVRTGELEQLTYLVPQYNLLMENADQARALYERLLSKYNEAQFRVDAVQAANFIQVVKPAYNANRSDVGWVKLALLALVGSLGLGVTLVFLLQYFVSPSPETPKSIEKESNLVVLRPADWKFGKRILRLFQPSATPPNGGNPSNAVRESEPIALQSSQDVSKPE